VTSIGQKMTAGKVHINADDHKVMLPYLADADFDFVAESGLARGDVILKFAGVELHDIAETRLGGQYAETVTAMAEASKEPADLATKKTPEQMTAGEIMPAKSTPVEAVDVSNPAQNADDAKTDDAASNNPTGDQSPSSSDETPS
jgi:hypothetical protein